MGLTGKCAALALLAAGCVLLTSACSKTGNAAATENPSIPSSLPLSHAGRWITDAQGRVVVIHGMNYVKKTQTKLADGTLTLDPAADGFGDNDLQWLQDNGFNGLRLGVEDYGVEPQPGVYDDAYIGQLVAIAKAAAAHNVHTLVDFHQDDFGPAFNGNGFSAWMAQDDGLPHQPDPGFPYNQFVEPALLRAWDHFWANDPASDNIGLQDHFAAAAARVAGQFAGIDALLGFEYLNEPWPGTPYATCLVPVVGCPLFDSTLNAFNQRVAPAIRAVDRRHLIFAEPNVLFNDGIPTNIGALQDGNAGFAFHVYCLLAGADSDTEDPGGAQLCPAMEQLAFQNADSHVAQTGEAELMTEFGATPALEVVSRITAEADAHMTSWLWWEYREGTGLSASSNPPDAKINSDVADLLVRAYPRAISGTPQRWSFDPSAHRFTLSYSTARADGGGAFPAGALSEIYLPLRHYPHGYQVSVTGGTVASAAGASVLQIASLPDAQSVQVTVTPD